MKKTILAAGMAVVLFMTGCGSAVSQQPDSQQSVVAETATGSENASGSTVSANESTSQSMGSSTAAGGPQGVQQGNGGMGADTDYKKEDTVLQSMISEVVPKFKQFTYTDSETGKTLTYNLYIPDGYNPSKSYPLVYFIADSSVVGQDATAPLTQGYGGIVWATDSEQAKHESFVLVPEYPDVVLDDHNGYTTTEYLEMTVRLLKSVEDKYSVDTDRIYATGQSMGCMIFMDLASEYPDLFAAELFVDGQWDVSKLTGLEGQKYFYFAAEGDSKAAEGQKEVMSMLSDAGKKYSTSEWDATWSADEFKTAVSKILAEGNSINCIRWKLGTVLPDGVAAGTSEHMYSFDHAYTTEGVRDWLFAQSR